MKKHIPLGLAVVVIGVGAIIQGVMSERWGKNHSERLIQFTQRLDDVPIDFGQWRGTDMAVDPEQIKAANCTNFKSRVYRNRKTNQEVTVFLVSGTARHVTIHDPTLCYRGAGFDMEGEQRPHTIDCGPVIQAPEFSTTTFLKEDKATQQDQHLRIFWAFTDDGNWLGPRIPKTYFAGRPALYKVYLITNITQGGSAAIEDSASLDFAKQFIPLINETLFPAENADTEGDAVDNVTSDENDSASPA